MKRQGRKPSLGALVAGVLLLEIAPCPAAGAPPEWLAGELRVASGLDFRSGDYGERVDTDILYAPLTLSYELDSLPLTSAPSDRLELSITLPYLRIRGPGDVVSGIDAPLLVDVPRRGRETEEGLGDVVVRGTYRYLPVRGARLPGFELTGKLKLPTADEDRRLGTGELDAAIELDVFRDFGPWVPFVKLGRRFMGDPPGFELNDAWLASVGLTRRIGQRLGAGLIYDWREAVSRSSDDAHELFAYTVLRLGPRWDVIPYGVAGLSDASPDYGLGLQIRLTLPVR